MFTVNLAICQLASKIIKDFNGSLLSLQLKD